VIVTPIVVALLSESRHLGSAFWCTFLTQAGSLGTLIKQLVGLGCPLWGKVAVLGTSGQSQACSSIADVYRSQMPPALQNAAALHDHHGPSADAQDLDHDAAASLDSCNADSALAVDISHAPSLTLRVWLYTSDHGPDQAKMRKVMRAQAAQCQDTLFLDIDCLMHQSQLGVKSLLVRIDEHLGFMGAKWRYFGSVAKVLHIWRDNSKRVFDIFGTMFGQAAATMCAKAKPPQCISGRWGSISKAEKRLLDIGQSMFVPVLAVSLACKKGKAFANPNTNPCLQLVDAVGIHLSELRGAGAHVDATHLAGVIADETQDQEQEDKIVSAAGPDLDTMRIEAQTLHKAKMGRWARESLQAVCDGLLWLMMRISSVARAPHDHLLFYLQSTLTEEQLDIDGGHVARLQAGRAIEIYEGFSKSITETDWLSIVANNVSIHSAKLFLPRLHEAILDLILLSAATFHRRILEPLERRRRGSS
jgi:hypothetical protein